MSNETPAKLRFIMAVQKWAGVLPAENHVDVMFKAVGTVMATRQLVMTHRIEKPLTSGEAIAAEINGAYVLVGLKGRNSDGKSVGHALAFHEVEGGYAMLDPNYGEMWCDSKVWLIRWLNMLFGYAGYFARYDKCDVVSFRQG